MKVLRLLLVGLMLTSSTSFGCEQPSELPVEITTHHDVIPVIGHNFDIRATKSGKWDDSAVWNQQRVPAETDNVWIPDGVQVVMDGSQSCENLIVSGTLEIDGAHFSVGTLTVLQSGTLLCGSELKPGAGTITFRKQRLDLKKDPYQFGRGLLVFGTIRMYGKPKAPYVRCADDLFAGDQSAEVLNVPSGWEIGDRLVVTDTRQGWRTQLLRKDKWRPECDEVTLTDAQPGAVSFSPLQYDHKQMENPHDDRPLTAHILNLTRSIVLENEDDEHRAHTIFFGPATVDVNYVAAVNLGRTDARRPLDNTGVKPDGTIHVGTNQIARYAWHFHHHHGPPNNLPNSRRQRGCVSTGTFKWGFTIHGTHFVDFLENVAYDCLGSGITLEDSSESNNRLIGNFCCKIGGVGKPVRKITLPNGTRSFDISRDGAGIWARGCYNIFRDNITNACFHSGYEFNGYYVSEDPKVPEFAGQLPTEYKTIRTPGYLDFDGNEAYGYSKFCFWRAWPQGSPSTKTQSHGHMGSYFDSPSVMKNCLGWAFHHHGLEAWHDAALTVENTVFINDAETTNRRYSDGKSGGEIGNGPSLLGVKGVAFNTHYTSYGMRLKNCHVYGCNVGVWLSGAPGPIDVWGPTIIEDGTFENHVNFAMPDKGLKDPSHITEIRNARLRHPAIFVPFDVFTQQYHVGFKTSAGSRYDPFRPRNIEVKLFGYEGRNLSVHYRERAPGYVINGLQNVPAEIIGLTNEQAHERFGKVVHGSVTDHAEVVPGILGLCKELPPEEDCD